MPSASLKTAALLLAAGFVLPVSAADKPQTPAVLKPEEFQAAFFRAQLPRMVLVPDENGKITKVWILKTPGKVEAQPPILPPGGTRLPTGSGIEGQRTLQSIRKGIGRRGRKPLDLTDKLELVDIAAAEGRVPATEALAQRMVIVAASFPYKKQVEEFRRQLRLPDHGAVLSKVIRDRDGKTRPAFQFRGLVIERSTLDRHGKEGPWERLMGKLDPQEKVERQPFDLYQVYDALRIQLPPQYREEKDDSRLQPILAASRGLVMKIPAQYGPKKAPKVAEKLAKIQETITKLEKIEGKKARPPLKETPLDYCLIRFLDPSVEPGKAYRYRFKVKMANPLSAKGKELLSAWATLPHPVVIPPDEFVYAVDQARLAPKLRVGFNTPRPSQAVFQIHRWVDSYPSGVNTEQGVGDWLVAARFFVERGEFVHTPPNFTLKVPVYRLDNPRLTLDSRPARRRGDRTNQIPVPFGDDSILVDFEGGRAVFMRSENAGGKIRISRIEERTPTEVLILRPDGTMIARDSATDAADPVRTQRYKDYLDRVEEAKKGPKKDSPNPFGAP